MDRAWFGIKLCTLMKYRCVESSAPRLPYYHFPILEFLVTLECCWTLYPTFFGRRTEVCPSLTEGVVSFFLLRGIKNFRLVLITVYSGFKR